MLERAARSYGRAASARSSSRIAAGPGLSRATMVRRLPSKQRNATVVQRPDLTAQRRLALLLLCGLVLARGFLYGDGPHFYPLIIRTRRLTLRAQHRPLIYRERH